MEDGGPGNPTLVLEPGRCSGGGGAGEGVGLARERDSRSPTLGTWLMSLPFDEMGKGGAQAGWGRALEKSFRSRNPSSAI